MLAAISALRSLQPKRIVVATPVAPSHARDQIGQAADEFVSVLEPAYFLASVSFTTILGKPRILKSPRQARKKGWNAAGQAQHRGA
jgi:hypothetical protein